MIILDELDEFIYSVNFIDYDKYIVSGFRDGYLILMEANKIQNLKKVLIPKEEVFPVPEGELINQTNSVKIRNNPI